MPIMAMPASAPRNRARENSSSSYRNSSESLVSRKRGMDRRARRSAARHQALSRTDQRTRRSWRRQVIQAVRRGIAAGSQQPDCNRPDFNHAGRGWLLEILDHADRHQRALVAIHGRRLVRAARHVGGHLRRRHRRSLAAFAGAENGANTSPAIKRIASSRPRWVEMFTALISHNPAGMETSAAITKSPEGPRWYHATR